jgi:hypothetical protein
VNTIACFFIGHNLSAVKTTEEVQHFGPWFADERTGLEVVTTEITNIINADSPIPGMAQIRTVKTITAGDRVCSRCGGTLHG